MTGRRFLAQIATTAEPLPPGRIDRARKAAALLVPLIETDRFMLWSNHRYGIAQVGIWRGDLDEKFPSIRMRTDRRGFQVVPALIDAGKRYSQV